jgi:hypothetical protein
MTLRAETLRALISEPAGCGTGAHPAGFQSSAGTRMSSHPIEMNMA